MRKRVEPNLQLIEFYGMLIMTYSYGHVWLISNYNLTLRCKSSYM